MQVMIGDLVGIDGVDGVIVVIDLQRRLRQVLQQAADMPPDGLRQKGRVQVALLSEVVDGSAVEEHRGAVHGNALPNP